MAYTVKRGDTLSAIARAQGVSLSQLIAANPQISNPNLILVGQRINLPGESGGGGSDSGGGGGGGTYTVVRGDTLTRIAARNGVSLADLIKANPQIRNPDLIRIGEQITIPGAGGGESDGGGSDSGPTVSPDDGITDVDPVDVGGTTIPQGASLVRIRNPEGSDATYLYYLVYEWRGVELAFEIGTGKEFTDLFGSADAFDSFRTFSQRGFDNQGYVLGGLAEELYGSEESLGSQIEREVRALGLEDLPTWLADSPDALALTAQATAQEWSSGRLWQELSGTQAFQGRYGDVWDRYYTDNATIADAVAQLEADEEALRTALRPFSAAGAPLDIEYLHGLLNEGWTPGFVTQVLEQTEWMDRDPQRLATANLILEASGLKPLDEVEFTNALAGYGPQETVEALNTATAAIALDEAGIDLADEDVDLIMDLVDTSDRLLTADSWRQLSQQLSLNLIRFNTELDQEKLGVAREDLIAAAFGQESPTGKSSGEVLGMLARFERDRRAAGEGFDTATSFLDERGQLRISGRAGL